MSSLYAATMAMMAEQASDETEDTTTAHHPAVKAGTLVILAVCFAITMQLLRLSIDLIQVASEPSKEESDATAAAAAAAAGSGQQPATTAPKPESSPSQSQPTPANTTTTNDNDLSEEQRYLILSDTDLESSTRSTMVAAAPSRVSMPLISVVVHLVLAVVVLLLSVWVDHTHKHKRLFPRGLNDGAAVVLLLGALQGWRDWKRVRFGWFQRTYYLGASASLAAIYVVQVIQALSSSSSIKVTLLELQLLLAMVSYAVLSWVECCCTAHTTTPTTTTTTTTTTKKSLSRKALGTMLKPYFWPDATDSSAILNRVRASLTWVCVALSKVCNLTSPILLGWAATALAHQDYHKCIRYCIIYCVLQLFGTTFKEAQSLIYLKVAQAAFVQLSETTFAHLHGLSLDWHLRKKLGAVIRSMDRGIAACDTLMKYLFLMLIPALLECAVVVVIFASYFQYLPLALSVFYFVFGYIVWTIVLTLWRKQFRKAVVKSDNDWHDKCTDSLINFETVKYFTAEEFEMKRFGDAVKEYQRGSVNVQASLSFLNISQQIIMQACLATSLSLAAYGIQQRSDCCITQAGCESVLSECCLATSKAECPGMEVGDFVAVLTYTLNLFRPLNFLGSVYNAVVMAIIDLTNLSELLAENPDVADAENAVSVPRANAQAPDVAVEFDNVHFHYPTQPDTKGLKGLSFQMKRGTTTAIVGPTGAGKTTVSRLLFRFYDVLSGAIKVNGVNVRDVTQKSLREAIGVVPQSASMFNDTLRSNLLYGKQDATQEDLIRAAEDAQLMDFIESLEDGWETMVGDRGLKLSGGEKQRAAIARCLLKDPPFVLLDEATSALDTLTENSVQEALERLGTDRTVLVIAHRLGTIRNADNIIVLKDGQVAEQGTHDQLLSKPGGVYAEMWNMQLHSTSASASQNNLADVLG